MIDTDKYKGHTPAPWELSPDDWGWAEHLFMQGNTTNFGNAMLITDAPKLLAEVKRLRKLEAAVVGSWMETINRGSSWHKQLRYPCVELGYLELRDVEHISRIGNRYTSKEFHLKEEYEEMAKQWIKEEYGVEEE